MAIKDLFKKINFKSIISSFSLAIEVYKGVRKIKDEKKQQDFLKALRDGDIDKLNADLLD